MPRRPSPPRPASSTRGTRRPAVQAATPSDTAPSRRTAGRIDPARLAELAAAYQDAEVIPHCTRCSRPCCRLDALVLEMNWKQVRTLWRIEEARAAFDRRLAGGDGPPEIRASQGLYYIHTRPCPAYDEAGQRCQVYGQALKPPGCSDFPVYENEGEIMADLRCEAVSLPSLQTHLQAALGDDVRIRQEADAEFPFLVTLSCQPDKRR